MNSTPEPHCACCIRAECPCRGDYLEHDGPERLFLVCSCCTDKNCACGAENIQEAVAGDPRTVNWTYAAYSPWTPRPAWTVMLTRSVRYMTPATARRMAADLLCAADYAEQQVKEAS